MSEIADFLRARYREAKEREQQKSRGIPSPFDGHDVELVSDEHGQRLLVDGHPYPIEKWREVATEPAPDPDIIADLDAKLAIVARHSTCGSGSGYCDDGGHGWDDVEGGGCPDLADLAQPFAGHPDHKGEEWAP